MSHKNTTLIIEDAFASIHPDVLERYQAESKTSSSQTAMAFRELCAFLYACTLADKLLVPSRDVDGAWHVFILFTREYRSWCIAQFGRIIEHRPLRAHDDLEASPDEFIQTVAFMREGGLLLNSGLWASGAWSASVPEKDEK